MHSLGCIALFRYKLLRKQRNKSVKVQRIHIFTIFVQPLLSRLEIIGPEKARI